MKKVYHLSTCDTCKRILKELDLPENIEKQDVKKEPLTEEQLEKLYQKTGSYEALFNKRAQLYKKCDLKNKNLTEENYKELLLEHYTFLKRPVFILEEDIFIGNSKKTVQKLQEYLMK